MPALIISFAITDLFIGYHSLTHWTWGSVFLIGVISQYFNVNKYLRPLGALSGACIFFILTNFGVWSSGYYGYDLNGLVICYVAALPFFGYTILSTLVYSFVIELILHLFGNTLKKYTIIN